ncbi:MAG: FAD-dependent oxidoreductase [Syntrophales bacterium]|nr:FAD-dependent oxidoreductase [Syntrophales bacterium]
MKEGKKDVGIINRRDFIKGVGVGAGVLALGQFSIVEACLLPKGSRTEYFNVVVIGTGLSGRSAALEARLRGAEVVLLEKVPDGQDGGNSRLALGTIVIPKDRSKEAADAYFEDFMKKSAGKGNAELSRNIADQVNDGVDWLRAQGVEMLPPMDAPPYRVKGVTMAPGQFQGMPAALAKLKEKFLKEGGKISYRTKAKQLIMNDKGRIIGVRALDRQGAIDFMADVVVIATGGYAANKEFLETYVDPNADELRVRGVSWATGDGLLLAREAGGTFVNMGGMASIHVAAVSVESPASGNPASAVPYCLGINRDGMRYVDESKGYVANGKAALKQPGQTIALVFDDGILKERLVKISFDLFKRQGIRIIEAKTLEELAGKIGAPPAKLVATVKAFNNAVKDGKATDANPPKAVLAAKLVGPKFYAFYPLVPGITLTFGGIRVSNRAQVLEADGTPIVGLYAAGECAGGLYYDDYIGGASLANCLVMGRVAGREAAAQRTALKKEKPVNK